MSRYARVVVVVGLMLAGCSSGASTAPSADALRSYVKAVEPIRLGVNDLLEGADPILAGYHDHQLSSAQATQKMGDLERRFADATVAIAAIHPADHFLAAVHGPYAHTFVLEDAYLSALVADLPGGDFGNLPNTQNDQRAAIIGWRTALQVFADATHVSLPADLQQAGRGEIAPSPVGS